MVLHDGEMQVSRGRGQLLAILGRTRLDNDRMALWRTGDIQRAPHLEVLAGMVDAMDPVRIGEVTGGAIEANGAVLPTVP